VCPPEKLMLIYKITKFSDVDGFLKKVATVLGKSKKGVLDITAAARTVLQHWNEGMLTTHVHLVLEDTQNLLFFQILRLVQRTWVE
jgi:hypothetical protein